MSQPRAGKGDKAEDQADRFRISQPKLELPKGGGAIKGIGEKFSTGAATGTGSMSIPIQTPPGRGGFGPSLALNYDSGAGNGVFGLGWHLSLPTITRKTEKGLPRYRDAEESDVFLLSDAEDLVPAMTQGTAGWVPEPPVQRQRAGRNYIVKRYLPRVEGTFARIERWSSVGDATDVFWRTLTKDNVQTLFGADASSRVQDPHDSTRIFSWLICESVDDKGNAILYDYVPEDSRGISVGIDSEAARDADPAVRTAARHPKRIRYGNRVSRLLQPDLARASWLFEVVFDYGEGQYAEQAPVAPATDVFATASAAASPGVAWPVRADPFSSRRAGFEVRTYRLCQRVLVFHHFDELAAAAGTDYLVRAIEFGHDPDPVATQLATVTQSGFVWNAARRAFLKRSVPPLEFGYSLLPTDAALAAAPILQPPPNSLDNLPAGLASHDVVWADLWGEGISGAVVIGDGLVGYKPNLGDGRLGPFRPLPDMPSLAAAGAHVSLQDLRGSGRVDWVTEDGFYSPGLVPGSAWAYRRFDQLPRIDRAGPGVHESDQTGDGLVDLMQLDGRRLTLWTSLAEKGFAPSAQTWLAGQEPPLVVPHFADMTGDGLQDMVTVRNGCVQYWPALGYGRFGPCVTMAASPVFDSDDAFDPARVRFADVDGSGTADLLYLGAAGVRLYRNQAGNGFALPCVLPQFQCVGHADDLSVVDFLGKGTACLVWSSPAAERAVRPLLYVDLMAGAKPRLLVRVANNLGAETRVSYVSSTRFYLDDQREGRPWATRLPFPVQVVETVETFDWVSRNHFATRYAYHHGYYDGVEREFRGFGMVEQWDTAQLAALGLGDAFPTPSNADAASQVPPVHIKRWYHTGVYFGGSRVSDLYAGLLDANDPGEYFREPGLDDAQARKLLLPDTVLPPGLSVDEEREACRALKGALLREETYGLDQSSRHGLPYTVTEQNFTIECVQPRGGQRHAVFFTHARESLAFDYERSLVPVANGQILADGADTSIAVWMPDPRVQHAFTLQVDPFGNVLAAASVTYGRRHDCADPALQAQDVARQRLVDIVATQAAFTNAVLAPDTWRTPLPAQAVAWELRLPQQQRSPDGLTVLFTFDAIAAALTQASDGQHDIGFEDETFVGAQNDPAAATQYFRRALQWTRTLYRPDDLGESALPPDPDRLLPLGLLESMAFAGEAYRLAFTPPLLADVYVRAGVELVPDPATTLGGASSGGGGYRSGDQAKAAGLFPATDGAGWWWQASGRTYFSVVDNDAHELAQATQHFHLPRRIVDAFGNAATVLYDGYDLLPLQTVDALDNFATVGEHVIGTGAIDTSVAGYDYRVLQPSRLMDANGNRTEMAFDALGHVAGTAVRGKPGEPVGDSLASFVSDLDETTVLAQLAAPLADPQAVLGSASTRLVYDLGAFARSVAQGAPAQPAGVCTFARETHAADPGGASTRIQVGLSYSDGFGREIQKKARAAPADSGPMAGQPRWIGSGWTVFNNKGKPVRQFEPFFTATSAFEFGLQVGVSAVLFYDPADRVVARLHPDASYDKLVVDAWRQRAYDANDTCAPGGTQTGDPRTDPDIAGIVKPYFAASDPGDNWETWYAKRIDGSQGDDAKQAALQAAAHADTPVTRHLDPQGRTLLTVADDRVACANHPLDGTRTPLRTRSLLDVDGKELEVQDALDRPVMRYRYDMAGRRLSQASMEAGSRWTLPAADDLAICAWDSRDHDFTSTYDQLRRPLARCVTGRSAASDPRTLNRTFKFERIDYGELLAEPESLNLRTRVASHSDTAGVVVNWATDPLTGLAAGYDFKGNLLRSTRRLIEDFKNIPDWTNPPSPVGETFVGSRRYDALNRVTQAIAPHSDQAGTGQPVHMDVVQHVYDDGGKLQRVDAWLALAAEPAARLDAATSPPPAAVTGVSYDAKGQRQSVSYANGVRTDYAYDADTFRLTGLVTRRPTAPNAAPAQQVQNLAYTYDAAGNVIHIADAAQQTVYFSNVAVVPDAHYVYDSTYRLIQAEGRERWQNGLAVAHSYNDAATTASGVFTRGAGDLMGRYTETYVYDGVGNFATMSHARLNQAGPDWTRTYTYAEPSPFGGAVSNRLSSSTVDPSHAETYAYDTHGNMLKMPQLSAMAWDFLDRLQMTSRQQVTPSDEDGQRHAGECTYYLYDGSGQRVSKTTELATGAIKNTRRYFGSFEVYDEPGSGLQRETLHLMDDAQRFALVETRTSGAEKGIPAQLIRYQHGNHLGSAVLELDGDAQVLSYEEYTPYGSTAYQAGGRQLGVPKRYRFTGMERDDETGMSYHRARYLAPWLGRWISADPEGLVDGCNLYCYANSNPVNSIDTLGTDSKSAPVANYDFKSSIKIAPNGSGAIRISSDASLKVSTPWFEFKISQHRERTVNPFVDRETGRPQSIANSAPSRESQRSSLWNRSRELQAIEKFDQVRSQSLPIDTLTQVSASASGIVVGFVGAIAAGASLLVATLGIIGGELGSKAAHNIAEIVLPKSMAANSREFATGLIGIVGSTIGAGAFGAAGGRVSANEPSATQLRNTPGVASASGELTPAFGRWLDAGRPTPIPEQVGSAVVGRQFNNFSELRSAIWEYISGNSDLNTGFSRANLSKMADGLSPSAPSQYLAESGAFGDTFNLHHIEAIENGGAVYDLSNLHIVSPKVHFEIHYGSH